MKARAVEPSLEGIRRLNACKVGRNQIMISDQPQGFGRERLVNRPLYDDICVD